MARIKVSAPGARTQFEEWIAERGGIQVWFNVNLSDPGAGNIFTPALTADTKVPYPAPASTVARGEVITDLSRFQFVKEWVEVKRFHVALRRSTNGLMLKCTDGSTNRINSALEKFPGSAYRFDYETQEAVIETPIYED